MTILRRVARNVADLEAAASFYGVLGFAPLGKPADDPELAAALGVARVRSLRLGLGAQVLELTQCTPPGAPYPAGAASDDPRFQHVAIVTGEIFVVHGRAMRAGAKSISYNGPQRLPKESGGVIAWKFRDPDGHPLELLQFPEHSTVRGAALTTGYDHSAIGVSDTARSIAFYEALGLALAHQHVNHGIEQDRLDGLEDVAVNVVAMRPAQAPPHVELLGYRNMATADTRTQPNDIAADRLVFDHPDGGLALQRDPDGHFLLRDGRK
ncbi:MAG: hypothetical protein B7Z80_18275 [Rhodospirillales bacterium 20-64-7]|nr:MAG: hypothetical protein B7Z80_18275 [Rhodospirillales bacterium 20-64-7]